VAGYQKRRWPMDLVASKALTLHMHSRRHKKYRKKIQQCSEFYVIIP